MDLVEVDPEQKNRHPWEAARFYFIVKLIKKVIKTPSPVIVDIGCGDAHFITMLSKLFPGGKFYAIDSAFTSDKIKLLNNSGDNTIEYYDSFESFEDDYVGKVDLIMLLDVIEHIHDDHLFLKHLFNAAVITSDTNIIITVPAFYFLFSEHDVFLKHYRRYTVDSLQTVIGKAGFISIQRGYFFFSLLIPRVGTVLVQKLLNVKSNQKGLGSWTYNRAITYLFYSLLKADILFGVFLRRFGLKLPGLSTYTLCKKSVL